MAYEVTRTYTRLMRPLTVVVNADHEPFDINIGRGTPWGNPFRIGSDGDREDVILKHRLLWLGSPSRIKTVRTYLTGKVLGCPGNCKPLPCHGDVYVEICDGRRRTSSNKQRGGDKTGQERREAESQRARRAKGGRSPAQDRQGRRRKKEREEG